MTGTNEHRGTIIDGKYRLIDEIGRGPCGVVYEAVALGATERVAIKLLGSEVSSRALRRAAETLRAIRHPNIAAPQDVGTLQQGRAYVVTERLRGTSLAEKLALADVMSEDEVRSVLTQVLAALHAAHEAGVVHGALSPSNVYLVARPNRPALVKLLDFGGASRGVEGYRAPEQARAARPTRRADIWACGALVYEALTGKRPFGAKELVKLAAGLAPRSPAAPSGLGLGLSRAWDAVVERALQSDPEARFVDALELTRALPRSAARMTRLPSLHDSGNDMEVADTGASGASSMPRQPVALREKTERSKAAGKEHLPWLGDSLYPHDSRPGGTGATPRQVTKPSRSDRPKGAARERLPWLGDSLYPRDSRPGNLVSSTLTAQMAGSKPRALPSLRDSSTESSGAGAPSSMRRGGKPRSRRSEPVPESLRGREISGKFVLDAPLGEGVSGVVYHGVQQALGRDVAIKILHARNRSDPQFVRRFRAEARVASKLDHVNITRVIDFGEEKDGLLYLVMEYVDGGSLDAVIARGGRLPTLRATEIGIQVCRALHAAHKRGIVHRDIKPANILLASHDEDEVDQTDLVKVCDFGTAKLKQPDSELEDVTKAGTLCGSPAYMAPEYMRGSPPDARSDVYSLGVTLYEALTGRLPFVATTIVAMFGQHQLVAPPAISTLAPGVDPGLEAVVTRMLEKDPDRRYDSARAAAKALGEVAVRLRGPGAVTVPPALDSEPESDEAPNEDTLASQREPVLDVAIPVAAPSGDDEASAPVDDPELDDELFEPLTKEKILEQREGELCEFLRRVVFARGRRAVAFGRLPTVAAFERSLSSRWQKFLMISAVERIATGRGIEALFAPADCRVIEREDVVASVAALRRLRATKKAEIIERALVIARESKLWLGHDCEASKKGLEALAEEFAAVDDEILSTLLERSVRRAPEDFTLGAYED